MPDFWFDCDSYATPNRGAYRFSRSTVFWDFLANKARGGVIASPTTVLKELGNGNGDALYKWAKSLENILFIPPDQDVQKCYAQIANSVQQNKQYAPHHVTAFLAGSDGWDIAYAKVKGGRIVAFEKSEPKSTKPKIPDVAKPFGVKCIELWDCLDELGFKN